MTPTRRQYVLADGSRVPGVTTIINGNLGWSREALLRWANAEGLEGRVYGETAGEAKTVGSLCHAMVEAEILGRPFEDDGVDPRLLVQAKVAYQGYGAWREHTAAKLVATEVHLVSERYRYGGTIDALGVMPRGLALVDWKTSRGTHADHVIQLAAYAKLWEEVTACALTGGVHLCRFDKRTGAFADYWWPRDALFPAWRAFEYLLALHGEKGIVEALLHDGR